MRKRYNKTTTSDIPMETSFTSLLEHYDKQRAKSNRKITAIGKKAKDNLNEKVQENEKIVKKSRYGVNKYAEGLQDLESFHEDTLHNKKYKSRRNAVIIVLLSVFLIAAIAMVSTYVVITRLETNCFMHVSGARATYIVDGKSLKEFRAPSGIEGNRILELEIKLKIKEFGEYKIKYTAKSYMGKKELSNVLIYGYNSELFDEGEDGYYYSKEGSEIKGGQTILLCRGIILDDNYGGKLDSTNFRLDFYTYLEKITT